MNSLSVSLDKKYVSKGYVHPMDLCTCTLAHVNLSWEKETYFAKLSIPEIYIRKYLNYLSFKHRHCFFGFGFFNECTIRLKMVVGGKALKESHTSKSVGNANLLQHRSQCTR